MRSETRSAAGYFEKFAPPPGAIARAALPNPPLAAPDRLNSARFFAIRRERSAQVAPCRGEETFYEADAIARYAFR